MRLSEPRRAARFRFHQAWFRYEVLGLHRFGVLPGRKPRALGSVLHSDDAALWKNFVTPAAADMYLLRRAEGWGVDPFRCTSIMTSSQALTINLFGVLVSDSEWMSHVLSGLVGQPEGRVSGYWLEYAPPTRSNFLGDMTRIDFLFRLETSEGSRFVATEVKLVDRHISRVVTLGAKYRALAGATGVWKTIDTPTSPQLNQIHRIHALALAISRHEGVALPPMIVMLADHADTFAGRITESYGETLSDPRHANAQTIGTLLALMKESAPDTVTAKACAMLELRYQSLNASELLWHEYLDSRPRLPAPGR